MIPGMNMNSRQMRQAMKRMGINQESMEAREVIIRFDDKEIIIENPEVAKVNMMGQETFQISGEIIERPIDAIPDIQEEDVQTVIDQTGVNKEEAITAIEQAKGDLAEAILTLQQTEE